MQLVVKTLWTVSKSWVLVLISSWESGWTWILWWFSNVLLLIELKKFDCFGTHRTSDKCKMHHPSCARPARHGECLLPLQFASRIALDWSLSLCWQQQGATWFYQQSATQSGKETLCSKCESMLIVKLPCRMSQAAILFPCHLCQHLTHATTGQWWWHTQWTICKTNSKWLLTVCAANYSW